jgi:hypothetical protein
VLAVRRPLPSLSVVVTRPGPVAPHHAVALGGRAAAAVAERHEVVVHEGESVLAGAAAVARHEWLLLVDARDAAALGDVPALVSASAGHAMVLGRRRRLPPRSPRARRSAHLTLLDPPARRRAGAPAQDHPLVLLRTDLARRLVSVCGSDLPAADLAVLAVLLGEHVAIVRVGASADRPSWRRRAPRAA